MKESYHWSKNEEQTGEKSAALLLAKSRTTPSVAQLWGSVPEEPLEKRMFEAAASEALSLAWSSKGEAESYQILLEAKVREAKRYVRRQRSILGKTEQVFATAF